MISLRPVKLDDIVGQNNIKEIVRVLIKSRSPKNALPHVLFQGYAGCGKTTFATVIANEIKTNILLANGGNIQKSKDILPYLVKLRKNDILFIDEIHRISKRVQESLFTAMEDFRYDIVKGARSIVLEPFTLLGATTEAGILLRPFYDRFEHHLFLDHYSQEELVEIVRQSSKKLKCDINDEALDVIAQLSRFTPRHANSFLKWCKDLIKSDGRSSIDTNVVRQAMELKSVDANGLDSSDKKYIQALRGRSKPLGLTTLMGMTGLSRETIEYQIEPFLMKLGMVEKTTRGRMLI